MDENDIEIKDLDTQRSHRFSRSPAWSRKASFIWWTVCISSLLVLVLLIGPAKILLLLRSQNQQPFRIDNAWASGHDVFLVADQTAIYVASHDNMLVALRTNNSRPLWHVSTDGPLSGQPVISEGIVYASTITSVYAVKASTGRLLWYQSPEDSLLLGQPMVGEGIVSMALASGSLAAWRASDGRPLWETSVKGEDVFPVAIADGMVFADTDRGAVVAVHTMTGTLLWKQDALKSTPPLSTTDSSIETSFDLLPGTLSRRQIDDGTLLWRHDFSTAAILRAGNITITEGGDLIYISEQNKSAPGGSLTVLQASTGKQLWQCATGTGFIPPLVDGNTVYVASQYGSIYARRADDGFLLWRYTPAGFPLVVVTVTHGTVYLGSETGTVEAVSADTGTLRWSYDADGPVTDVIPDAQGTVLIGAGNGLIAGLQEETGTPLWHSSPLV